METKLETRALESLVIIVMTSAKDTGAVNIHQMIGDMETMSLLFLIDVLVPLDPPVVVTVVLLAVELVLLVGVAVVRQALMVLLMVLRVVELALLVVAVDLPEEAVVLLVVVAVVRQALMGPLNMKNLIPESLV